MGIKDALSSLKSKVVDANELRKARNLASDEFEKQNFKFQKTDSKLPSSIYGIVDVVNNKFICRSSDELKVETILKGTQNGSVIRFNVVTVYKNQQQFDHKIEGVEPFPLDVCDIQILK
ncbi:MAG: hypothetical protein NC310_00420 [Roseburia sp.]|nr:hypothetical protein [Anaeroplasma bactoclasticum]MCM1195516.1 hypothetical protein [Roseburia sp.]